MDKKLTSIASKRPENKIDKRKHENAQRIIKILEENLQEAKEALETDDPYTTAYVGLMSDDGAVLSEGYYASHLFYALIGLLQRNVMILSAQEVIEEE